MSSDKTPSPLRALVGLLVTITLIAAPPLLQRRAVGQAKKALESEIQATREAGLDASAVRRQAGPSDPLTGRLIVSPHQRTALHAYFLRADTIGQRPFPPVLGKLLRNNQRSLDRIAGQLSGFAQWQASSPEAEVEQLQHYRDLAALFAARAVQTGNWRDLRSSLEVRHTLRHLASAQALHAIQDASWPALETIAAWLAEGRKPESPDILEALLSPKGPTLGLVLQQRLGRMIGDLTRFLDDRDGPLADDYRLQAGTATGLWFRQALAGTALTRGIRLTRKALLALKQPRWPERLAALGLTERELQAWLSTVRTQFLYRTSPLKLARREVTLERSILATRLCLELARTGRASQQRDPLTGKPLDFTRVGGQLELRLPAATFAYPRRTRWRVKLPR